MKILGKQFIPEITADITLKTEKLKAKGVTPTLAIVKSKNAEDVNLYIGQKVKRGAELGINVNIVEFPDSVLSNPDLLKEEVKKLNADPAIHGIIFQKPSHQNVDDSLEQLIDATKDVDGFLPESPHRPPVYRGVIRVLKEIYKNDFPDILTSKTFVIIGKGKTGGGPVIDGLKKDGISTFHVIDSKTTVEDIKKFMSTASIVITAVGKSNPIDPSLLPSQGILIDFGVHMENGKGSPDFYEHDIQETAAYYTTTPGGIGPLTAIYLMDNVCNAAMLLTQ